MIRIRLVSGGGSVLSHGRLEQVQEIFSHAFPELAGYELKLPSLLSDPLAHGYSSVLILAESACARIDAFALVMHFSEMKVCFLDFIATRPSLRGAGVGGALYEATREHARQLGATGLYFEVDPDDGAAGEDPAQLAIRRRRIRFYERYGARLVAGTDYDAPVGSPPTRAFLMFDPLGNPAPLRRDEAKRAVEMILTRRFAHVAPPEYVRRVIHSFQDDPVAFMPKRGRAQATPQEPPTPGTLHKAFVLVPTSRHEIHHVRERGYFERPIRHEAIRDALQASDLFEIVYAGDHGEKPIRAVHDADFIHYLRTVCGKLKAGRPFYPDTFPLRRPERPPREVPEQAGYYCIDTGTPLYKGAYVGAKAAVNAVLTAADEVLAGNRLAYAACRPPGHHAGRRFFGGFCYFNNAAIAAAYLSGHGRTAVLDIDYHHGNGTQDIFYDRGDVLTLSIHGHPDFSYPYFSGYAEENGRGDGAGFNRNFPLPEGTEAPAYLRTLDRALDLVEQFQAEILVVGLGFDILKGDPTGRFAMPPAVFRDIGRRLVALDMPLLIVQEGGYNVRNIRSGVKAFFRGAAEGLP